MSHDIIATQRVVADLLLDPEARRAWEDDPHGFASARLTGADDAAMVARLQPAGIEAAALSHVVKKARFDHLHRLHHEHEDRQNARRAELDGPGHDHDHDHGGGHDHPHHHDLLHPHHHGDQP